MKAELARIVPDKACCQMAELAAFAQVGLLRLSSRAAGEKAVVTAQTRNPAVARKLLVLCKRRFPWPVRVDGLRRRARRIYRVELPAEARADWHALTQWRVDAAGPCCRTAFLRGALLGAGYLIEPAKGYHLEWVVPSALGMDNIRKILSLEGIAPGIGERKGVGLVYLKEADAIADVLGVAGAHEALLEFENVRVVKGMRNQVNRLVNAETANVDKTVAAALRQVEAIRRWDQEVGLNALPRSLRAVAEARLAHPDASLRELGERLEPPLSKSAVSHRMRRLMKLVEGGKLPSVGKESTE